MSGNARTSRRSVLKSIGATSLGTLGYAAAGPSPVVAAGEPVFMQYFHEKWPTVEDDIPTIADVGYDAIWIQNPCKCKLDWSDQSGRNDPPLGYQPVDFRTFDSAFGTESDLQSLIDTAHSYGVEVYLDTVMNHMASGYDYDFPAFSYNDFHHDVGSIDDWSDPHQVKHGELLGLPDLAQDVNHNGSNYGDYVRSQLKNYMDKMASVGADGHRFDAVKHIYDYFWDDHAVPWADNNGMFKVGEVYSGSVDYVQNYVDTGMHAFDYPLFFNGISSAFDYGDMSSLKATGLTEQDPYHSCPFVDNHDKDAPPQYELAYAYATTIEGYPVHYNLYPDWLLGNSNINNMVWVKKNLAGGETYWRHSSNDLLVYERYNNLLVGLNNNTSNWKSEWVYTSWNSTTLHDYSGNASDISTDGNGWVQISVPPEGWVFYAPY
ncbi:MAG: alpha-amylase domain-containing protein [Halapricum sp.]